MSLMSVLFLVGLVVIVGTSMVAVYSADLNLTQRSSNGSIAQAEAEAGIAEALYRMTLEENLDNSAQPPKVFFGRNQEEIRATITPNMAPDEAYHVLTFNRSSSFPHSTNNTYLDSDQGSLDRTVPDGTFHLVSTGYCRGQFRTVECVVKKPPFPFGLATSGPIESPDPLVVRGVSSTQALINGNEDRPGHILSNSSDGIQVGSRATNPPKETFISGFVKSVGPIAIDQPAQVLGGLRPGADESTLADIDIPAFKNEGQPGVVTLLESTVTSAQEMDIMYYFQGDTLTYERSVQLDQAFLYVEGNLVMKGPVTGEGLIVVDGDARFESGTALSGSNKMAVLASGDMTIIGNNNYFAGLVYAEGNLSASNVTIVGNTIVNSSSASEGRADLQNVGIVGNEETADMTITITSGNDAVGQNNTGDSVPLLATDGVFGYPPDMAPEDYGNIQGWIMPGDTPAKFSGQLVAQIWAPATGDDSLPFPEFHPPAPVPPGTAGLWAQAADLFNLAKGMNDLTVAVQGKKDEIEDLEDDVPIDQAALDAARAELTDLEQQHTDYEAAHAAEFAAAETALVQATFDHKASFVDEKGTFDDGIAILDIIREERFNLNEYLPESEIVKVTYWRVHNQRF